MLLEVSLRVLPKPEAEITLCHAPADAQKRLGSHAKLAGASLAVIRIMPFRRQHLSPAERSGNCTPCNCPKIRGGYSSTGEQFWTNLREQQLPFFHELGSLWRISLPPATPMLDVPGEWLLDWGGAQRWLMTSAPAELIHAMTNAKGGHASCFRGHSKTDWIKLEPGLLALHQRIKRAFDPQGLFNPHCFNPAL